MGIWILGYLIKKKPTLLNKQHLFLIPLETYEMAHPKNIHKNHQNQNLITNEKVITHLKFDFVKKQKMINKQTLLLWKENKWMSSNMKRNYGAIQYKKMFNKWNIYLFDKLLCKVQVSSFVKRNFGLWREFD